jgi:rSAM/selenodomain-associated transferase 1
MLYPQSRLMVFCKAPEAGEVKTRLAEYFEGRGMDGEQISARVHEHLALHCLRRITKNNAAPVQLWCSPNKDHPFFQKCKNEFNLELKNQGEGDLGERMSNAYDKTLQSHDHVIVIGTDCPMLNSSTIEQAFSLLNQNECSVIGPAEDGGYFLLGLSKAQPEIFNDISWGSSQVFIETLNKLSGDVREVSKLWDVDRSEDFQRLVNEAEKLELSDDFRRFLKSIV